jgi:hypothetical protein
MLPVIEKVKKFFPYHVALEVEPFSFYTKGKELDEK